MTKKESKPMGRPKTTDPADKRLPAVRITQSRLDTYRKASKASGKSFSQWIRDSLDKSAEEDNEGTD